MNLSRALTFLRIHWLRQGWPLQAGLAALVACAVAYALLLRPFESELDQLQSQNVSRAQKPLQPAGAVSDRSADMTALLASLPADEHVLDALYSIHILAQDAGLVLDKGEYRSVQEPGSVLRRHEFVFPTKGRYPPLQAWLRTLAQEQPTLALSSLVVQRDNVQSDTVDARVTFVLFAKAP
jgi:hypothetical protein